MLAENLKAQGLGCTLGLSQGVFPHHTLHSFTTQSVRLAHHKRHKAQLESPTGRLSLCHYLVGLH